MLSPLFPFFLQVSSFSFHWDVSLKKEKVVCSFKSISHWKQREINKLRGRRWIEKVTTWNAAIVGERKRERIVDSVKQSEAERWKPLFRHAANRTFPLVCQSPILSSYIPSLSPDAPSEVFPLMKRIEFFKLKSLIRNKVFHPFTIALEVQLLLPALFTMEAFIIKGVTVGYCRHWSYRNENCGEQIDTSSSTAVSILCECFCLMHSQVGTYHIGVTPSGLWSASHCHYIATAMGNSLTVSMGKRLLTYEFWHHAYRLLSFSLQAGVRREMEMSGTAERKEDFLGRDVQDVGFNHGQQCFSDFSMCESQPESKIPRRCH